MVFLKILNWIQRRLMRTEGKGSSHLSPSLVAIMMDAWLCTGLENRSKATEQHKVLLTVNKCYSLQRISALRKLVDTDGVFYPPGDRFDGRSSLLGSSCAIITCVSSLRKFNLPNANTDGGLNCGFCGTWVRVGLINLNRFHLFKRSLPNKPK